MENEESRGKPFQRFRAVPMKTVKTVSQQCERFSTGLKPGVNEKDFRSSQKANGLFSRCHDALGLEKCARQSNDDGGN